MAGPTATKSPEEGAETPVYLALLPSDAEGPHGEFAFSNEILLCSSKLRNTRAVAPVSDGGIVHLLVTLEKTR
eukprot:bmy_08876T0